MDAQLADPQAKPMLRENDQCIRAAACHGPILPCAVHEGNEKEASGRRGPTFPAELSDERLDGLLQRPFHLGILAI